MKHKFWTVPLALAVTFSLGLGLAACGSDEEQKEPLGEHSHVYTTKSACDLCGEEWHATETDAFTFTPVVLDGVDGYDVMFGEYQEVIFTYDENGLPIWGDPVTKGKPYEEEEIVLPCVHDGKPVISVGRFQPCNSSTVKKITIPDSIISFARMDTSPTIGAISRCSAIQEIVLPYEPNLGSVTISEVSPLSLGTLFANLEDYPPILENYTDGALYIGDYLMDVKSVAGRTFTVREGTKGIAAMACCDLSGVEEIRIPDSVTEIGNGAFGYYSHVGSDGEGDISPLKKVVFGENSNLKKIDNSAFYGCWSLTEIDFPDKLEAIGELAFEDCILLSEIRIPDSVRRVGSNAFRNTAYEKENIKPDPYMNEYNIQGDELYNGNCLIKVNPDFEGHYTVRAGTTAIAAEAFSLCTKITSVTLPEDLEVIEEGLFSSCGIESIEIPKSVKSIGNYAFYDCQSLTSITIPGSVKEIGNMAFAWCDSLKNITISEGVAEIGSNAINGTFQKIVLPKSLRAIGMSAFASSGLTEIEFRGTVDEWFNIRVKDGYNQRSIQEVGSDYVISSAADYTIVCTDGTIAKDGTVTRK